MRGLTTTLKIDRLFLVTAAFAVSCAGSDEGGDGTPMFGTTTSTAADSSGGDDSAAESDGGGVCVPGSQTACACPGGVDGVQVCLPDGSGLDTCDCGGADDGTTGEPDPCGNAVCDADEDCTTCEMDCGVCEPCTSAPSCEGALIPPVIDVHADFLDDPLAYIPPIEVRDMIAGHVDAGDDAAAMIAAALSPAVAGEAAFVTALRQALADHPVGAAAVRRQMATVGMSDPVAYRAAHPAPTQLQVEVAAAAAAASAAAGDLQSPAHPVAAPCDDPRMRIRVAMLTVHEEDDDFANDEVYCAISSEATDAAEIKITPITPALDEGDNYPYNLDSGVVWGQADLVAPKGNLLLSYNCIESDTANGYSDLLGAVGDAANAAGGIDIPGVDGWVFPAVGIVANLLAGSLSLDGDDMLFNVTQVVPETEMLNLTSGAWWSVRRNGTHINSDWDWELRMEIWGCHDNAG
jgi:hypothetical protein